jgi:hypothetical protein
LSLVAELAQWNPWWLDKTAVDQDPLVTGWEASRFKWTPRLGETFQWDVDVTYVLRGPRQVGKSTLLKLKVRYLLNSGVGPRQILYYPCDLVEGPEKLVQLVNAYQEMPRDDPKERLYIFLDEISSVRDWQKGIKSLYDQGRLKRCTLVLTGSHSIDLRKATETLARRRGEVGKLKDQLPDKILLPMKFSEYVDTRSEKVRKLVRDLDLLKGDRRHALWAQIMKGVLPDELKQLQLVSHELQTLFQEFLLTGGVPKVIDTYLSTSSISKDLSEGYVELLLRDIRRWNGRDIILRQIVRRIVETFGTTVTLNSLRQETDVSSHHTTGTYIDFLRDSYVVTVIHKLDRNRNAPVVRDSRKVHFEDPFMFHALRAWALGRDPRQEALNYLSETDRVAKLVESVVANHLVRLLFSYQPSSQFDYTSQLFHWQSANQRQLDFVAWIGESHVPIEVKYQTRVSSDDAIPIIDFQKGGKSTRGIMLTKDALEEKGSYVEIPVHLGLALV